MVNSADSRDGIDTLFAQLPWFFLVALIAFGAWLAASAPEAPSVTEKSFEFTPLRVDRERLEFERKTLYGDSDLSKVKPEVDELLKQARAANLLQFEKATQRQASDATVLMTHAANELITKSDLGGFMRAGEPMFEACEEGFEELLAAVRSKALEPALAREDPGDKYSKYKENCGRAYIFAERWKLIKDGQWTDKELHPVAFSIMRRYTWASVLHLRRPAWLQLTPYEHRFLTDWRVRNRSAYPLENRLQTATRAGREIEGYPVEEVLGTIYFLEGQRERARGHFERACALNKKDELLQAKCAWLEQNVPKPGPDAQAAASTLPERNP